MKKTIASVFITAALSLLLLGACRSGSGSGSDAPAEGTATAEQGKVALTVDAAKTAGIQLDTAMTRTFHPAVKASGTVALNMKSYVRVTPKVAGRIERVSVFLGDRVRAGQELCCIYSPELLAVQAEYLQILARAPRDGAAAVSEDEKLHAGLLKSTEARLRLLGFEDADLASLRANRLALTVLPVRAPRSGTVIGTEATTGSAFDAGAALCDIADTSTLWVNVHIFEKDLASVAAGAKAEVAVAAYPGEVFPGTLSLIGAIMDESTRTVTGRVDVANRAGRLKPGMFADVTIVSAAPVSALCVPEQAVRSIGSASVVFVPGEGGSFLRRDVVTGRTIDGFVEVLKGLAEGERVVTGGSFDIKAEMLKGSLEGEK